MWIFGYGSLIWKADFPFQTKIVGRIKGFDRKFFQHSTDHRGTKDKPGRVVTLIPTSPQSEVWGIAYQIRDEDEQKVIIHLDFREKEGYKRRNAMFYPNIDQAEPFEITLYAGTMDNLNYAGYADEESIANQIISARGISGTNWEYVCNLAKAMREIAPHVVDHHLFTIETKVLKLTKQKK